MMGAAMQPERYLLIDGTRAEDTSLLPMFHVLHDTLVARGVNVETLRLQDVKLGHCIGCFDCWLKTPGQCVQADAGRRIVQSILSSDTVLLFGRVMFGTYSPEIKRLVDRCLSPLNLPYLQVSHGETHHRPRYDRYPRLVSVGVQGTPDADEAALFKLIVGRNALQLHAPSYAVSVVSITDSPETLRHEFVQLSSRINPPPHVDLLKSYIKDLNSASASVAFDHPRQQALLLLGSPKARPSTSAALGGYLMQQLEARNWQTQSLKLHPRLHEAGRQNDLLKAVNQSDLIILSFPLYNDTLPYHVTYALQLIAQNKATQVNPESQQLVVIVNNGFPEPHHNLLALEVCRRFARRCGLNWAGGFAVGGGEALSAGQPLQEITRRLPPVKHLMRAIDLAAEDLSKERPVSKQAEGLISRNPIYPAPFWGYRWIFQRVAAQRWEREAAENGLSPSQLHSRPYLCYNS
jgi:multimeric flavodoxin WrbA